MLMEFILKLSKYSGTDRVNDTDNYKELKSNLIIIFFYFINIISRVFILLFVLVNVSWSFYHVASIVSLIVCVFYLYLIRHKKFKIYYVLNTIEVMMYSIVLYVFTGYLFLSYSLIVYAILLTMMAVTDKRKEYTILAILWIIFLLTPFVPVVIKMEFTLLETIYLNALFIFLFCAEIYVYDNINNVVQSMIEKSIREDIEEVNNKAYYDELTGTYNRHGFVNKINELIESNMALAFEDHTLAYIDIDDFKKINDTYGHYVGDIVLKVLCSEMVNFFRNEDIISRWGGEEFVLLASNIKDAEAYELFENFRKKIENKKIYYNKKSYLKITVTMGINTVDYTNFYESLKISDEYLYYGKRNGKNIVINNIL